MEIELKHNAEGLPLVQVSGEDHLGRYVHTVPVTMLASWSELLGYADPAETLEAILYVFDHGEPDADPETGENSWTETYHLLRMREQAREDAALEVKTHEGHTDYQVQVAAEQMAYRAVHEPIGGGECAMDRCRREARRKLGVPDPTKKCGVETRTEKPLLPEKQSRAFTAMRPADGKAQVVDLLADQADYLHACTKRFLHSLTDHEADPLEPEPEDDAELRLATPEETLAKYQGGHP